MKLNIPYHYAYPRLELLLTLLIIYNPALFILTRSYKLLVYIIP